MIVSVYTLRPIYCQVSYTRFDARIIRLQRGTKCIQCFHCHLISYQPEDVYHRWCPSCGLHESILETHMTLFCP